MKIKSIYIENFRAIEKCSIDCVGYNSFVGPNGSGKSTVLDALNVFFGDRNTFSETDFFKRKTDQKAIIQVTFHDLDESAAETFTHYVRNGELVISAQLSCAEDGTISKVVRGQRLVFKPFQAFFEAKTATEAKPIFDSLRESYPEIESASNGPSREAALRVYEENLSEDQKELVESGEEFFGISKGTNRVRKHVHWVYVPAVKDATGESEEGKTSYLGKLIQHTVKSGMDYEDSLNQIRESALGAYDNLLNEQQQYLESLEERLSTRLRESVTSDADLGLSWKRDEKSVSVADPTARISLTDRGFSGDVDSFGHGLQRSFLMIILQELVASDSDVSPTLILGCEEPELYQHPPQARHLASILMEMSRGDAQIFISTHSPYFIDVEFYDGIKMFRNAGNGALITASNFATVLQTYNTTFNKPLNNDSQIKAKLSVQMLPKYNEVFFAEKVILVEGISDQACLEAYIRLSGKNQDFQRSGSAIVVCEGKSSLAIMLIIAKEFGIPFHVVFDCDSDCDDVHKSEHLRDNNAILSLAGHAQMTEFPEDDIVHPNLIGWLNNIEGMMDAEFGEHGEKIKQAGRHATGNLKSCKKSPMYVATVMSEAWAQGKTFPTLEGVIDRITNS
ncbi:ATP-dependent endonuclease [Hoeflea sp. AS60]|uniref:ATP-dependent nuclease n=1 Tax=Hoeflea sp. AS60 TaxID=3135780 RepID=UPI00317C4273